MKFARQTKKSNISRTEAARLGHVTRARISQITSLLYLAPDIQETILFLPRIQRGRDLVILHDVLPIAAAADWSKQRRLWRRLGEGLGHLGRSGESIGGR
jgi:hypothetical protein